MKDNLLFMVIGLLTGFIGGYLMHEAMSARQPALRAPGAVAETPAGTAGTGSPGQPGAGASSPAAAMEQVQRLRAYVEENPGDADALRLLANMNYDISNWQRAAELYTRYLELRPRDVDVMTDLGATYRFLGDPRRALAQFQEIRELAPDHWQSRYNEILVLAFDLGDLEAAAAAMSELRALQPGNPEVSRLAEELARRARGA